MYQFSCTVYKDVLSLAQEEVATLLLIVSTIQLQVGVYDI